MQLHRPQEDDGYFREAASYADRCAPTPTWLGGRRAYETMSSNPNGPNEGGGGLGISALSRLPEIQPQFVGIRGTANYILQNQSAPATAAEKSSRSTTSGRNREPRRTTMDTEALV